MKTHFTKKPKMTKKKKQKKKSFQQREWTPDNTKIFFGPFGFNPRGFRQHLTN